MLLVVGLIVHVVDTGLTRSRLSAASIVLVIPGLCFLFLGWTRTVAMAFPLAFLAFMLPIPLAVTEGLHVVLRHVSAAAAATLVRGRGFGFAEGTTLHIANATLEVADACSGLILYAAMATAFLVAYTAPLRKRKVAVLVFLRRPSRSRRMSCAWCCWWAWCTGRGATSSRHRSIRFPGCSRLRWRCPSLPLDRVGVQSRPAAR